MIERVSRYYDGPLSQTIDPVTNEPKISVYRSFPSGINIKYITYVWKASDELSLVANRFNIGTKFWWEITDINPEILDPFDIVPGTVIRIPYGN